MSYFDGRVAYNDFVTESVLSLSGQNIVNEPVEVYGPKRPQFSTKTALVVLFVASAISALIGPYVVRLDSSTQLWFLKSLATMAIGIALSIPVWTIGNRRISSNAGEIMLFAKRVGRSRTRRTLEYIGTIFYIAIVPLKLAIQFCVPVAAFGPLEFTLYDWFFNTTFSFFSSAIAPLYFYSPSTLSSDFVCVSANGIMFQKALVTPWKYLRFKQLEVNGRQFEVLIYGQAYMTRPVIEVHPNQLDLFLDTVKEHTDIEQCIAEQADSKPSN